MQQRAAHESEVQRGARCMRHEPRCKNTTNELVQLCVRAANAESRERKVAAQDVEKPALILA